MSRLENLPSVSADEREDAAIIVPEPKRLAGVGNSAPQFLDDDTLDADDDIGTRRSTAPPVPGAGHDERQARIENGRAILLALRQSPEVTERVFLELAEKHKGRSLTTFLAQLRNRIQMAQRLIKDDM